MLWLGHQKTAFFQATKQEQEEAINRLISQGTMRSGYYLLLLLATLIVTPGLFLNNFSVVIGGMLLAPLLIPLLSLSLSLVTGNVHGCLRSVTILSFSVLIAVTTSALLTFVLKHAYDVTLWYPDGISPGIYIFIAFCSGVAGAFAWVKEDLAPAIAGVATAVALLPPLCIAGIGLALWEVPLLRDSLVIFGANLLGIIVAAFLVFWVLGFLNSAKLEEKIIKEETQKK